jgi:serine/threonine-protein kinase
MSTPSATAADLTTCARCGTQASRSTVSTAGYACPQCQLELAHLDTAPNGTVRGVIGWLRSPGDVVNDRYRIGQLLGRGGFAVTYLVEDQLLNGKRRALKEIPEILFDEGEADILSRVQHPAIPDITDRCTHEGMVYLVLEFGGSRSLESVRQEEGGQIGLAKLTPWIEQVSDVLSYLHAQDPPIVHRDLKPENLLLDERDHVMIIDFGIAKLGGDDAATRTIARAVSHGFSPPEQALGTGTDQRSDVYALGATVYALLTGKPPPPAHERVTGAEIVPPSTLNAEVGPELEAVLLKSLTLNILQRHESIEEFRQAMLASCGHAVPAVGTASAPTIAVDQISIPLTESATTGSVPVKSASGAVSISPAPPLPQPRKSAPKGIVWAASAVVLVALVALAAWRLNRSPDPVSEPEPRPVVATPDPGQGLSGPVIPIPGGGQQSAPSEPRRSALDAFEERRVPDPEPPTRVAEPTRPRRPPPAAPVAKPTRRRSAEEAVRKQLDGWKSIITGEAKRRN